MSSVELASIHPSEGKNEIEEANATHIVGDKWSADQERAATRRLDFRILPILFVLFGLSFLDRR